jgi:uncharacterized membrane protein YphA (DoxX/SURF4 family)
VKIILPDNYFKMINALNKTDIALTRWMAKYGIFLLRISVGVVFFWFGFLKYFPGLSPATELATKTIDTLTFGIISGQTALFILATLEVAIGVGMIFGIFLRETLLLLFFQMLGTITPIFLFPAEVFTRIPFAPSLEGQYIIKNIIIVSAALVIGATVRGGRLVPEPELIKQEEE